MMEDDALQAEIEKIKQLCSSGNEGLDSNLGGGIPWGSLVLISGDNAVGKSTLMQQFAIGAMDNDYNVMYINTEQTLNGILDNMTALSWDDAKQYFIDNKFNIIPTITSKGKIKQDTEKLFPILEKLFINSNARLNIVDTLNFFTQDFTLKQYQAFFSKMRQVITSQQIFIFVFPTFYFEEKNISQLANLFDVYLSINYEKDEGSGTMNSIINVMKFRTKGELIADKIPITVDPAFGIRVSAVSSA